MYLLVYILAFIYLEVRVPTDKSLLLKQFGMPQWCNEMGFYTKLRSSDMPIVT